METIYRLQQQNPVGFSLFVHYSKPHELGGIPNIQIPTIQATKDRAVSVLEKAPRSLSLPDRRTLLVGYIKRTYQNGWSDREFTTSALVDEFDAINRLRPWYYQLEENMEFLRRMRGSPTSWNNITWVEVPTPPRAERKPSIWAKRRILAPQERVTVAV